MKKITFLMMLISALGIAQPDTAPPTPPQDQADVVAAFSDSYTGTPTLTPTTFGQSANSAAIVNLAGNDVYQFTIVDGDFQGFDLSAALNLSAMENLHYDIWIEGAIPVGNVFNTTLSQHGGGHLSGQTAGYVHTNATLSAGQEGQWLSFDIPFSEFGGDLENNARDIISQLVFSYTNFTSTDDIYIDNIYFWRESVDPNSDSTLSDLQVDGTTVDGFAPAVVTYDVELPNGTTAVPTVTGTATQEGTGSSDVTVTPAGAIPGSTTVLVTAPNGTDTTTYTVNFTEAALLPPAAPTPPSVPAIGVISDVFTNVTVPQVDVFGGTLENLDLNTDGNDEARLLNGGSGFQFNFFPGDQFIDISQATTLHLDVYVDGLADTDILRIRLLDTDPGANGANIARYEFSAAESGTWVSIDLDLPSGSNLNDFGDIDSAASPVDLTTLALIQVNTLDLGSSLGNKDVYLSNIYFFGGSLSTSDFDRNNDLRVYPNPTTSDWTVSSSNIIKTIAVYDILGKRVLALEPNSNETKINTATIKSGVYFAKIESENGSKTVKLVRE